MLVRFSWWIWVPNYDTTVWARAVADMFVFWCMVECSMDSFRTFKWKVIRVICGGFYTSTPPNFHWFPYTRWQFVRNLRDCNLWLLKVRSTHKPFLTVMSLKKTKGLVMVLTVRNVPYLPKYENRSFSSIVLWEMGVALPSSTKLNYFQIGIFLTTEDSEG